jgi:hypothetical protein
MADSKGILMSDLHDEVTELPPLLKKPDLPPEVIARLIDEVVGQDVAMSGGYEPDRDGVRMAISSLEDEVRELLDAWREERDGGPRPHIHCGPTCDRPHAWRHTRVEAMQVAAIAIRLARDLWDC